jgi:hypothetical protein
MILMAAKKDEHGGTVNPAHESWLADTKEDIKTIDISNMSWGSTCLVIEDGSAWMLNSKKEWKEL